MKKQTTCMKLVQKNFIRKCCIFIPFLLLALPLVVFCLLDTELLEEMVVPFICCLVIAVVSLVYLMSAIRGLTLPSKSHLGKCVLLHGDGIADVKELFEKVDKDIGQNGSQYKEIAIGEEWVVGKTGFALSNASAARLSHIQAIFYHHLMKSGGGKVRHEFAVHTVDKDYNDIVFKFSKKEYMIEAYETLCLLKPDAVNGSHEEWETYMHERA